jgi:hypothetical protein
MIDWLLQRLVQEAPAELSVCEFDCTKAKCTASSWAACDLRRQVLLHDIAVARDNTRKVRTELPAYASVTG